MWVYKMGNTGGFYARVCERQFDLERYFFLSLSCIENEIDGEIEGGRN